MSRFSERVGARRPREVLQLGDIDEPLRIAIWNAIHLAFTRYKNAVQASSDLVWWERGKRLAVEVLNRPVDEVPYGRTEPWLKGIITGSPWHVVYDVLEWVVCEAKDLRLVEANAVLAREGSGYRFLSGQLAPITSEHEIKAIEGATAAAERAGHRGAATHLSEAVAKLAQKPEPDFRNSIKESISAVESALNAIAGTKAQGVKEALAILDGKLGLHGGFAAGIKALYGWTSQDGGIRHAILDERHVGDAEARFMLVACSALVHFLEERANATRQTGSS